jgi:uncharacterized membrane protein
MRKETMTKHTTTLPLDILLCLALSLLLVPFVLFTIQPTIRLILALPFILFIPGYVLVFALFPARKTDRGIDTLERLALSFGLSIAVVPLIGLLLNYTPWGIRLEPILRSLLIFIFTIGIIGIYRWRKTDPQERFTLTFKLTLPKQDNKTDKALTIILVIVIIIVLAALIYVITLPRTGETFTELYILGPTGKAAGFPQNLTTQENATVLIGVNNHEHRQVNYTIEIWLINQTTTANTTIYHHMWHLDTLTTTLPYQPTDTKTPWQPQWTYTYTFNINRSGTFKLAFLLFTTPQETYTPSTDYHEVAAEKINSAYRENHLWINVI